MIRGRPSPRRSACRGRRRPPPPRRRGPHAAREPGRPARLRAALRAPRDRRVLARLGIVHHRAVDALRRSLRHDTRRASDEGLEERFEAPDRTDVAAARREEAAEIRGALAALPAEQSKVIELAYFGGFSHSEIAGMLQTPVGTVKGRIRLGLEKLRGHLGDVMEVPA